MKNETFREIGYWSSVGAAILGLINCILCFIKGIKVFDTELSKDPFNLIAYTAEHTYSTVLYKISLAVLAITVLSMMISFFINAGSFLKTIMAIARIVQAVAIGTILLSVYVIHNFALIKVFAIIFAVMELVALILYLIERDHRKTITRVVVFFIATAGSGIIFMLVAMLLIISLTIMLAVLVYSIFKEPEHKTAVIDLNGKVIAWLKRE